MRSKEDANDYRYFPEPDVPPLLISDSWIKSAHSALPELPDAKFNRYTNTFGLPGNEAEAPTERAICEYFDQLVASRLRQRSLQLGTIDRFSHHLWS